jgi:hypothetical protein
MQFYKDADAFPLATPGVRAPARALFGPASLMIKLPHLLHTLLVICALLFGTPALHAQTAGNLDPAFAPNASYPGTSVIAVQPNGKTIIAGNFNIMGTTTCNGLARLNVDGTLDTAFTAGLTLPGQNGGPES